MLPSQRLLSYSFFVFSFLFCCLFMFLGANPSYGWERKPRWHKAGPFRVTLIKVVDGDSVRIDGFQELGPDAYMDVRLRGIDAPETYMCRPHKISQSCAQCANERKEGLRSKKFLREFIDSKDALRVVDIEPDKYNGRIVADLQVLRGGKWLSLSQVMLENRLAIPYDGGKKEKIWCENT